MKEKLRLKNEACQRYCSHQETVEGQQSPMTIYETESAWFFSNCLHFWSFCLLNFDHSVTVFTCIEKKRQEGSPKEASMRAFSNYSFSSWPSQVASFTQLHHLTFHTREAVETRAPFKSRHLYPPSNSDLRLTFSFKLTFWSLTSIHTSRKSLFNAPNSSSTIHNI